MVYIPNSCILKSQGLQVPTKVFVLVIFTQLLVKHQNMINPVGLTKYHTIAIVIFVTITISILIYYHDNIISNYLYYLPALYIYIYIYMFVTLIVCIIPCTECEITVLNDSNTM